MSDESGSPHQDVPGQLPFGPTGLGLLLVLAIWVQRHLPGLFFAPDDLMHLQQAAGLVATAPSPHRILSQVLYFRAMLHAFGPDPLPFYVASLLVHLVNVGLVYAGLIRVTGSRPLAWTSAALFALAPVITPMLGEAVDLNGALALMLTLAAFLVAGPGLARVTVSAVCFVLALFSKESVLLLPVVPALGGSGRRPGGNDVAWRVLLTVSVAAAIGMWLLWRFGLGPGDVYQLGSPATLLTNLATYSAWVTDLVHPLPDILTVPHRELVTTGLMAFVLVFGPPLLMREQRRIATLALAWWLLGLAPVLILAHQTYLHYAYTALPGAATGVAATLVGLAGRAPPRGARWRVRMASLGLLALIVAFAARANTMIGERLTARTPDRALLLDPTRRKSEMARRAVASVRAALLQSDREVIAYVPPSAGATYRVSSGARIADRPGAEDLLSVVLNDGRALRLFLPSVASFEMVNHWPTTECDRTLVMRGSGARFMRLGPGPGALANGATLVIQNHLYADAVDFCDSALVCFPRDSTLQQLRVIALAGAGRFAAARSSLAGMADSLELARWLDRAEASRGGREDPRPGRRMGNR